MFKSKCLLLLSALVGTPLLASVSVQLNVPSSTIEVGQTLTVTAAAKDSAAGNAKFSYQFTMRPHNSGSFMVMQDYYFNNTFLWTPSDHEGAYDIGVTAWSESSHNSAPTYITVNVNPKVTGNTPVLSDTNNALVALYSAPPCSAPAQMRVYFKAYDSPPAYTSYKPCNGLSMNFYIGGMLASTTYTVQHFLSNGVAGPQLSYTTGQVPANVRIPNHMRLAGPESPTDKLYPFLLHGSDGAATYATDLYDHVVWYRTPIYPVDSGYMTRLVAGGTFLTIDDDQSNSRAICGNANPVNCGDHQYLREYDLAGNIIRSTSWAVVNDEVNSLRASQGGSRVRLNFFSHDVIRLPNGYTAVIATDEQVKTLKATGTQDVFGDMIIVLDANWQVTWAWDAFDYLDINRMTIGGVCVLNGPGCPAQFFQKMPNGKTYTAALDWTHANSLFYDPADGNFVMSLRHQSWAIKVNYNNNQGDGRILWRLGYGGDFALAPGFPVSDWFSGQHDVLFHPNGLLTLFDNNNASTVTQQPGGDAHGQAWRLNTATMVATPVENIDLGVVSPAVGSADLLSNGNIQWQAGYINGDSAQTFEFTPSGDLVYKELSQVLTYRSFRLADLYTPTP